MDYYVLMDLATDLGHRLAMAGAETFRVEESIRRIMYAYGIEAEVFAIPNCMTVSIVTDSGKPLTRMRRVGYHGNDLDAVERYNNLSRRICQERPDPCVAAQWMKEIDDSRIYYKLRGVLAGSMMGAFGFSFLYGGSLTDSICAAICGLIIGVINYYMDKLKANQFFRIIFAAFIMAIPAYCMAEFGIARSADSVVIGALMLLVPGLIFTNAMRDIIYGDINSGINRIVQVFLIAVAIAMGTAAAWKFTNAFLPLSPPVPALVHDFVLTALASMLGCAGFAILFNIHGNGLMLCAAGGLFTWGVYYLVLQFCGSDLLAYFYSTIFAATYAEIMARVRKYPAISYLVVSIFPLIPGAGVYYTMNYAIQGDMKSFANNGTHTAAIAGVIALGILLASTVARILSNHVKRKKH